MHSGNNRRKNGKRERRNIQSYNGREFSNIKHTDPGA